MYTTTAPTRTHTRAHTLGAPAGATGRLRAAAEALASTARRQWHQAQRAAAMNVPAGTVKRGRA
ncbi:hypothetical protein SSP35_01_03380 [Streptomyces sp. NBRC 110611]|uniref:hypothetical protein n=1 Tax=Streptomyces sp. NBRC 110611 TaxID=1621259 RepID=UPI00082B9E5C|nr:hypothetical protein [Streptomyces sp. NBRC 110611]GAU65001.1 hypothetical protein SSP35_01_03380 [Streptomyces sp. NBRC 110611]